MEGYFPKEHDRKATLAILGVCVSKQKCAEPKRNDFGGWSINSRFHWSSVS